MAIRLHGFISNGKRYIQVENQLCHITGIFRNLMCSGRKIHSSTAKNAESVYFECEEDGTITFYQAANNDMVESGIWTYLVYECLEDQETVFLDSSIDTSTHLLKQLFAGKKLLQETIDINEYLRYQSVQDEYLEVQLPSNWNTRQGQEIANILLEELKAFQTSSIFAERAGQEYVKAVLCGFIQAAQKVLENGGTRKDFELAQDNVLKRIRIDDIANLILECNDYRIWQAALPSKSKAVEYAFNKALNLICRLK
ncbi:MAG: hypothetical protein SAK29_19815 [Scytonema sp. PMC 1069.18]|nr:hypothetical protein [Scytonema sp. PMC 1069.18]MEC4887004.1 hypothetical protein [Scytonema sp. PMC 1070.18]